MRRFLLTALMFVATASAFAQPAVPPAPPALLDARAPLQVRLEALKSVAYDEHGLYDRPALVDELRKVMIDKQQPADLRLAIFGEVTSVFFPLTHTNMKAAAGHDHHMQAEEFNAQVRTLLDDPDVRLQKAAFAWLSMFADSEAIGRAVAVLEGRGGAPLSTAEAIGIITFVNPTAYSKVVYDAYRGTHDIDAREAALRVLGNYAPAREDLVRVAQSSREAAAVRLAALDTLYVADREAFAKTAAPLLAERSETSDEVIARAITLMRIARSQPPYRERKLKGFDDDFDRGVRALLDRRGAVGNLAHQYLLDTDPTYRPQGGR